MKNSTEKLGSQGGTKTASKHFVSQVTPCLTESQARILIPCFSPTLWAQWLRVSPFQFLRLVRVSPRPNPQSRTDTVISSVATSQLTSHAGWCKLETKSDCTKKLSFRHELYGYLWFNKQTHSLAEQKKKEWRSRLIMNASTFGSADINGGLNDGNGIKPNALKKPLPADEIIKTKAYQDVCFLSLNLRQRCRDEQFWEMYKRGLKVDMQSSLQKKKSLIVALEFTWHKVIQMWRYKA